MVTNATSDVQPQKELWLRSPKDCRTILFKREFFHATYIHTSILSTGALGAQQALDHAMTTHFFWNTTPKKRSEAILRLAELWHTSTSDPKTCFRLSTCATRVGECPFLCVDLLLATMRAFRHLDLSVSINGLHLHGSQKLPLQTCDKARPCPFLGQEQSAEVTIGGPDFRTSRT